MAYIVQSSNRNSTIFIDGGDHLYVSPGVTVDVNGGDGVYANGPATVEVYGSVLSTAYGIELGQGGNVIVGLNGVVRGSFFAGIAAFGNFSIQNDGLVEGTVSAQSVGISANGSGVLVNNGTIQGVNTGVVLVGGTLVETYNYGTITGGTYSYQGVSATEHVLNAGTMNGTVQLGDGANNIFDSRTGEVFGTIRGGTGNDTIYGPTNGGTILGGNGRDLLVATGTNDSTLNGGAGTDTLKGADGNDLLIGGLADSGQYNQLFGGAGSDTASYVTFSAPVYASVEGKGGFANLGSGYVLIDTYDSVENLRGGEVADVLVGDGGANRITGGGGVDQLYGRGGADTFVYLQASESSRQFGYDTIADFQTGLDKIDLTAFGITASRVLIASNGVSTSLYADVDGTPGFGFGDLAISFAAVNALVIGDVIF